MVRLVLVAGVVAVLSLFMLGAGCPGLESGLPDPADGESTPPADDGQLPPGDGQAGPPQIPGKINERHEIIFTRVITGGARLSDCIVCHQKEADDILNTGHWKWKGVSANILGHETGLHGKADLINNFCIAVPSNEARCSQCHISVGWKDKTFNFASKSNIDCLICHDTSNTYQKSPTNAGAPADGVNLQQAAIRVGKPNRKNCGFCHFYSGGGDNVKHGDLAANLVNTTREFDVHMGVDGQDFTCQECHVSTNHGIAGMALHSLNEGRVACTDCHTGRIHDNRLIELHLDTVACQTCHIPRYSRATPTVTAWYWDEAGQDISPIPVDEFGKPTYDKKKGRHVHGRNLRPELMWFNGKYRRMIINVSDTFAQTPVVLAEPVGDYYDLTARIYPFKKMVGRQPADKNLRKLLVPHLFGSAAGPNAFWKVFDWSKALAEGTAYAGQAYSGEYEFVDTVMYLPLNHEVAPASMALTCTDCHDGGIDFTALGYRADPWFDSPRDQ